MQKKETEGTTARVHTMRGEAKRKRKRERERERERGLYP